MAVSKVYTLYAVNYDPTTDANAMLIDQVTDFRVDPRIQEILLAADGQVDPTFVATMAQDPRITFSSSALATILAKASNAMLINALKIDSDAGDEGLECWFRKLSEGGTRVADATEEHLKMTINEGLLIPRAIRAAQGQLAVMDFEAICGYDGTNAPIVLDATAALSGTPAVGEAFTLGPVSVNGSALDNVQNVSIMPGIVETVLAGDGQVWPTYIAIMDRRPLITVTTTDVSVLSTYGISGTAQSGTDSIVYLRKLSEGGTRVADATAQHISITVDEGQIRTREIPASQGAPAMAQVEIRPTWDGANDILVISAATAIS